MRKFGYLCRRTEALAWKGKWKTKAASQLISTNGQSCHAIDGLCVCVCDRTCWEGVQERNASSNAQPKTG